MNFYKISKKGCSLTKDQKVTGLNPIGVTDNQPLTKQSKWFFSCGSHTPYSFIRKGLFGHADAT